MASSFLMAEIGAITQHRLIFWYGNPKIDRLKNVDLRSFPVCTSIQREADNTLGTNFSGAIKSRNVFSGTL